MNRLAQASSPYLQQHRDNPVAWWEWGPEAFAEARRLDRPVLLSVGYAACHWCHVMAHESFEDEAVAATMNEHFVAIKVDREERPDVDHLYMSALHALGEQGGWPLTMFLTPQGEPFWGGTYFPKEARFGRPGFADLMVEVSRVYREEPERVANNRTAIAKRLAAKPGAAASGLGLADIDLIGPRLADLVDPVNGGLQGAPKFPNPPILELLWRFARRTGHALARERVLLTLERMARGGIHDHLAGGFARYSVDERWLVPHFEKMLYDNAQLLELYALAAAETGQPVFREAAEGIVAWLEREMTTPEGAFASSLDADSEGEEGRFAVFGLAEVREVLGEDADLFARTYDVTEAGNWEGTNILNRLDSGEVPPETERRLAGMRARLMARRAERVRPGLDDKVLADWNGLTICALVRAALLLGRPDWLPPAERAYRFVTGTMARDGRLGHSFRHGKLIYPGFALDHAAMMRAALALAEATGTESYLADARRFRDILMRTYLVAESGLLAMTAKDGEALMVRPQPSADDAVPNANGVFVEALVRLAQIGGRDEDRELAEDALATLSAIARPSPINHASILNALDLHLRGLSVVVTGEGSAALREAALRLPYLDRSVGAPAASLGANHPARSASVTAEGPQAVVCAAMRCSLPVRTVADLQESAGEMLRSATSRGP